MLSADCRVLTLIFTTSVNVNSATLGEENPLKNVLHLRMKGVKNVAGFSYKPKLSECFLLFA